jgi:hypothetical protein
MATYELLELTRAVSCVADYAFAYLPRARLAVGPQHIVQDGAPSCHDCAGGAPAQATHHALAILVAPIRWPSQRAMIEVSTPACRSVMAVVCRRVWGVMCFARSEAQVSVAVAACLVTRRQIAPRVRARPARLGNSGASGARHRSRPRARHPRHRRSVGRRLRKGATHRQSRRTRPDNRRARNPPRPITVSGAAISPMTRCTGRRGLLRVGCESEPGAAEDCHCSSAAAV